MARFLNVVSKNSFRGAKSLHCFALTRRLFCDAAIPPSTVRNGSESSLNLIVDTSFPLTTTVRRLDLRSHLFSNTVASPSTFGHGPESAVVQDTTTQTQAGDAGNLKNKLPELAVANLEWIDLPSPIFSFEPRTSTTVSFPLMDGKVVITDHFKYSTVLLDADTFSAVTMPNLHKCKQDPVSLFVPRADGGNLYIFESILKPESPYHELSDQFEVMVCDKPTANLPIQSAYCQLLPPPPFVQYHAYEFPYFRITAYAVVGSDICISAEHAGTYRLDTCSNTWHKIGDWTLPFDGKVEYVPELKLWFGFSAARDVLAAADLSAMDSQPQLVDMDSPREFDRPKEWMGPNNSQLVNLGSGRFCIARSFENDSRGANPYRREILILTGLEVIPPAYDGNCSDNGSGSKKVELRKHKSRCHMSRSDSLDVY